MFSTAKPTSEVPSSRLWDRAQVSPRGVSLPEDQTAAQQEHQPDSLAAVPLHPHGQDTLTQDILDPDRLLNLNRCDVEVVTYNPESFACVFVVRGRNASTILPPLLGLTLWSIVCSVLFHDVAATADTFSRTVSGLFIIFTPLHAAVSFLLVFRLGRAAVRFWDARAASGKMVEACRILCSQAAAFCADAIGPREAIARWTVAFPVAVKNYLRQPPPGVNRRSELLPALCANDVEALLRASSQPIHVLNQLRAATFAAADAIASAGRPELAAAALREMSSAIDTLTGAWGAMERINSTPLPFVYVAHLRTFLILYLAIAPLPASVEWGWSSIPAQVMMHWALLGIEAAAVECERPFRRRPNHLTLGRTCVRVAENAAQTFGVDLPPPRMMPLVAPADGALVPAAP